ncbi:OmpA family protein [Isoalcanivorax indicus]|uniref:OmpA family protein n=1 Tax=Isoalcanivorax indicus TaxID=2202653 RepID=UPI000DB936D9|nr:OmpA family protein [Isoalcanivorax indicus]
MKQAYGFQHKTLPTALLPVRHVLRRCLMLAAVMLALMLLVSPFLPGGQAHAAVLLEQPPATLNWQGAPASASADARVLRYERVGLYRHDPASSENLVVRASHFASTESLVGTPSVTNPLPAPLDSDGNPLPLDTALPLSPANSFAVQEAVFVVVRQPILPATAFAIRTDGRRIMAVTVESQPGDDAIIALVETDTGSGIYVGYLQPGAGYLPPGSDVRVRYDDYGIVADSLSSLAPWLVSAGFVALVQAERQGVMGNAPVADGNLYLSKRALRNQAMTGDFIAYEVRVENTGTSPAADIEINDRLPRGFRYQSGSLRRDGIGQPDPQISPDGQQLRIQVGNLAPGASVLVRYVVEVTIAAPAGQAVNRAQARSGSVLSNEDMAAILVERPFFDDRAFLMGRVIAGECGEADAEGVAGVRLYLEDGTQVVTDADGRWHMEGVRPGTRVLQLDTVTLGNRYTLQTCPGTSRQAGNPLSRFLNIQGGTLWRENWYLKKNPEAHALLRQQLTSAMRDGQIHMTLSLGSGDQHLSQLDTELAVPQGLLPVPGSLRFNDTSLPDPAALGAQRYHVTLPALLRQSGAQLTWQLQLDPDLSQDSATGEAVAEQRLTARTLGQTQDGHRHAVQSENRVAITPAVRSEQQIILRPRFSSMSAALSPADREQIRDLAEALRARDLHRLEALGHETRRLVAPAHLDDMRLRIVGHTDSVPIVPRAGRAINDNYALSLARATAVADYLGALLKLDAERLEVRGAGPDLPLADNGTEEGRARNRRVTIDLILPVEEAPAMLNVTRPDSGMVLASDDGEAGARQATVPARTGLLNIADGTVTPHPVISVSGRLNSDLRVRLLLNDEPVPASRIGMRMTEEGGTTLYTWVGIELPRTGDYTLTLQGLDNFGNARFSDKVSLRRSGRLKTIRVLDAEENVADGLTPVQLRLALIDEFDQPIRAGTTLQLVSGDLRPLASGAQRTALDQRPDQIQVDSNGLVHFEPVSTAGTYRIRLSDGYTVSDDIAVPVSPDLRDWILVGFAEGTVGYNRLRGNMQSFGGADEHFYTDGEAAFFARGRVAGEWLLTAAYDSRSRLDDEPLNQALDPQRWYVLYGDDTRRGHDAPSREKLYVRMERRDFFALFGDFDTGLTVTELTRYQRVLTGAQTEWRGRNVSGSAFHAETPQGFIRDDIRPDGTSGLYRLSRAPILPGSETVTVEVRDRFTNEVISSTVMTRFVDYSLDSNDGTFFFRQPIPVQDAGFNPLRIVVTYEVDAGADARVMGGRVTVHDAAQKLVLGLTGVEDNSVAADARLGGADLTWTPDEHHVLRAEMAASRDPVSGSGTDGAWLAEHRYTSERVDTRVRAEQTDAGFGLGQLAMDDDDRRMVQGSVRYRLTDDLALAAEASRQSVLGTGNERNLMEGRAEYEQENWRAFGGLRYVEDQTAAGRYDSRQVIGGGRRDLMDGRLSLSATGETGIDRREDNADYPTRLTLGSDYRLTRNVSVFAAQEFSWSEERRTQDTRIGARATPWQGGTVSSQLSHSSDEYGPRVMAHAGLFQTLDLSSQWRADFGLDRAQTLTDNVIPDTFDPRRDPASGTAANDYTAVSAGLGYRDAAWEFTQRAEYRYSDLDEKWNLLSGFRYRLNNADSLAGRILHFDQQFRAGGLARSSELDISYARRPLSDSWFWLNRTRLIRDETRDDTLHLYGHRIVNNTHVNLVMAQRHQLSTQYGARYVADTIDDTRYTGYSDLIGLEYRYDITERWDIGTRGSRLHSWQSDVTQHAWGVMAGYSPIRDVWISMGYNFRGFYDRDFTGAEGRVQGIVLDFRIKFDQTSARRRHSEMADD